MSNDLVLRSRRVVTPDGIRPAAIVVSEGTIIDVAAPAAVQGGEDFGDLVILPGLVDSHVHINEPGRVEWEGFASATRAAAAGGVTTLADMPLNSVPATTSVPTFQEKLRAAAGQCWVDVGFWGGLVPVNLDQLAPLAETGVLGFKCFLVPSGVPEFEAIALDQLAPALRLLRTLDLPLLVHAELPEPIEAATRSVEGSGADPRRYSSWLDCRPCAAENEAIAALIQLAAATRARIHVVHLSSAEAVPMLRAARARGVPITVETCPHYLYFSADEIPDDGTEYKCAPPIRDAANREALWRALDEGVIDLIASDHSPAPPELKRGDFFHAWGGIASLQLRLGIVWSGARSHGFDLTQLARWLCAAPAALAGLSHSKGAIEPGRHADFVIWDPDAEQLIEPLSLQHRHKQTPYLGRILPGVVHATYLRGTRIYDGHSFPNQPTGGLLLRST